MTKRVVIVGAGYAGVETALYLNRHKKKSDLEIVIVDKNPYHTLLTELHEVAGNRVSEDAVKVPLHEIFRYTSVKTVTAEVSSFDLKAKVLTYEGGSIAYDTLVLAMGGTPNDYGIPGLKGNSFPLWSYKDAILIRNHISNCFVLGAQEADPEKKRSLLTFVVGGAGFTGVEMMGELALWTKSLCKQHGIDRTLVKLMLVDCLPTIMSNLSKKNMEKSHRYLEKQLGVEILLNTAIEKATEEGIHTGSSFIGTKTFIWAAGIRSNEALDSLSLEKLGVQQRVMVDEFGQTAIKDVYAIGDIAGLKDKKGGLYPAMVEHAIQTGRGVAKNILAASGGRALSPVTVEMHGIMVCIGRWFAVSDVMGKAYPLIISILMKYLVNMHYLWEITGFRGVYKYLKHEFTGIRQKRTLLEVHWSERSHVWWQLPIRLFLGAMWFYEGVSKVLRGWLTTPLLASFLGMSQDAGSSATPAGLFVLRTDEIFQIQTGVVNFFMGLHSRLVAGDTISEQIFVKFDIMRFGDFNLVPWFLQNVVLAGDGIAMFFQVLVVVLEIAFGLMLLGGAFTFVASIGSLSLLAMFLTSMGLYEKSWWMVFASIVTLGGSGRAFGLDYWLIPWVTNVWDSFWKNRKFRLFFKNGLDR